MFDFKEKLIDTKNINNYKLIILHGENQEQKELILTELRNYFGDFRTSSAKEMNDGNFRSTLMTNDLFGGREFFFVKDVEIKNLQSYLRIFNECGGITRNFFVLICGSEIQIKSENQLVFTINCRHLTQNERLNFIKRKIAEYKINLNDEQTKAIAEKFADESVLTINNEMEKLQIAFMNQNVISDSGIETLLDLNPKTQINLFMRMIIYEDVKVFKILPKFIQDYSAIFVIKVIYNYFINLSKVFLFMKIHACNFDTASKKHYGVILDEDLSKFKQQIRKYNFRKIRNILFRVVECEIALKKNPDGWQIAFITLFNKMFINLLP